MLWYNGTVATEILHQNPDIDAMVVPIGAGGLITGMAVEAKHLKPGIKIIGVETEACPAMVKSLQDGKRYKEFRSGPSICDGLIGGVGALSYRMAKDCIDDILVVSEEEIKKAICFMAWKEKFIVEGASATTVAAVKTYPGKFRGLKNIALVITGGNIDGSVVSALMRRYCEL